MLTLQQGVLDAQARGATIGRYALSYRRRYWDIDAQTFVVVADWVEVPRDDIEGLDPTREALDRSNVNEFKSSNITVEVKNAANAWSRTNPNGLFARADSLARLGYEQQLMEFKVEFFYEMEDGTESAAVRMFTGYASEFNYYPQKRTVAITLESRHVLLRLGDAERVSVTETNKLLVGVVNGINKDFYTAENGVGRFLVNGLTVNGVVKRPGIDVQISDTNDSALPAHLAFTDAPPIGASVRGSYIHWFLNQKPEDMVKELAVQAGIPLTEQDVEPVIYSSLVINNRIFTTKAHWDAGLTLQNIDTAAIVDSIQRAWFLIDDFADGTLVNPTWTLLSLFGGGGATAAAFYADVFSAAGDTALIYLPFAKATGTFAFRASYLGDTLTQAFINFIDLTPSANLSNTGYTLKFAGPTGVTTLLRQDAGTEVPILALPNTDAAWHDWKITRNASGSMTVYKDGVSVGTVSDNTYTTNAYFSIATYAAGFPTVHVRVDDIYWSPNVAVPTPAVTNQQPLWESTYTDGTAGFGQWSSAVAITTAPAPTAVLVETATADESFPGSGVPGAFDPYVAVGGGGQVLSVQRRFLKVRAVFTDDPYPLLVAAITHDITVTWTTSTTTIRMANFLGMTCFEAIRRIAEIAGYEWGFGRTGRLFFRARSYDRNVDMTVDRVREISRISDGVDRIYNQIQATYGTNDRIIDSTSQLEPRPHSMDKYGVRRLTIGGSQILVDPDADIATGLALVYYNLFKEPRLRYEVTIEFRPQIELSDTLRLRVRDELPNPPWHIGDSSRHVGEAGIHLFGHEQQSAFDRLGRVLSASHDIKSQRTRLELEEI